ncbi:MAG: mechanosensitive ion channel family protein [Clostridiales bacterium]|nr:mechanosensitive ion channel family protein [Clostridiales bacterium]
MDKLQKILKTSIAGFTLENLCLAIVVFVISFILIKALMKFVGKLLEKSKIEKTLHSFIKSCLKILLYALAIIISADSLGIPITSLVAVFSVAGLAVSLAVQGTLSNLASGITILISKPFKVNDYIEVADVSGFVNEIGLIYTKLLTIDNKVVFLPNSEISATKIVNYTSQTSRRIDMTVTASYNCGIDDVKAAIREAISDVPEFLSNPEPFVNVWSYGESSIEYMIRAWVKTADYWPAYFALLENIKHSFDRNGIEMTYNHLNVHFDKQN